MDESYQPKSRKQIYLEDTVEAYRETVLLRFAIATSIALAPFIVYAFIQQKLAMGLSALSIVVVMVIDALFIHNNKRPPIKPIVIFLPIVITIAVAMRERGIIAILWAYPSLVMAHFILDKQAANGISGILLLVTIPMSFSLLETDISLRVAATLVLTMVFANIFSTAIIKIQNRLHDLATIDPLTGAFNRRHLEVRASELTLQQQAEATTASMLLLDIDHFKLINDEHGHEVGDKVLRELVRCVKDKLRNGDDVFRLGGEEFVVLLPGATQYIAADIAESLRYQIAHCEILDGRPVTVSIGCCEQLQNEELKTWLKRCDDALYLAKEKGRNRVETCNTGTA